MTTENIDELRTRLNAANQAAWSDLTSRFDRVLTELNHDKLTSSESIYYQYVRLLLSHLDKQADVKVSMNVYAMTREADAINRGKVRIDIICKYEGQARTPMQMLTASLFKASDDISRMIKCSPATHSKTLRYPELSAGETVEHMVDAYGALQSVQEHVLRLTLTQVSVEEKPTTQE